MKRGIGTDRLRGRRVYRYEVSEVVQRRLPRVGLNRYGWKVIGIAVVVGRYAYCLRWAAA